MAKLQKNIEIPVFGDAMVVLRRPTSAELSYFEGQRYTIKRRDLNNERAGQAREDLFDLLVVQIDNLYDDEGEITITTLHRFPPSEKRQIIFEQFESGQNIDIKN